MYGMLAGVVLNGNENRKSVGTSCIIVCSYIGRYPLTLHDSMDAYVMRQENNHYGYHNVAMTKQENDHYIYHNSAMVRQENDHYV